MAKYVENFGRKVLLKIALKNCVEELDGKIWLKGVGENVVENCVEKVVGKIRLKKVDKFGRKVLLKNCLEQLNLVENFYGKVCWNNQVHKLGVQFSEIIGLNNLMEKFGDNLGTKLGVQFSFKKIWKFF